VLGATLKADVAFGAQPTAFHTALINQAGLTQEEAFRVMNMNIGLVDLLSSDRPYVDECRQ